jgi:hypothetical protein
MSVQARRAAGVASVVLGSVYAAWLGFATQTTGDYGTYFAPAMNALLGGHVRVFLRMLPPDGAGGSLLLRAPAALLGKLLIGGSPAAFRAGALECALAGGLLGVYLARGMRRRGARPLARASVIAVYIAAPVLLSAVLFGHPEEVLGATLCVAAVLLAAGGHAPLAGVLIGLAVVNKPWALLALAPALLAAPAGRSKLLAGACAIPLAWYLASYLAAPAAFRATLQGLPVVAHPVDLWWPLAHLRSKPGVTSAYFPPAVIARHARELVLVAGLVLSAPLLRRRERGMDDCLALLALLFLLRCLLDPSNHVYYEIPFVFALTAWEAQRGAPVLALLATGLLWLVFHTVSGVAGLDVQYAAYLLVTLPYVVVLIGPAAAGGSRPVGIARSAERLTSAARAAPVSSAR